MTVKTNRNKQPSTKARQRRLRIAFACVVAGFYQVPSHAAESAATTSAALPPIVKESSGIPVLESVGVRFLPPATKPNATTSSAKPVSPEIPTYTMPTMVGNVAPINRSSQNIGTVSDRKEQPATGKSDADGKVLIRINEVKNPAAISTPPAIPTPAVNPSYSAPALSLPDPSVATYVAPPQNPPTFIAPPPVNGVAATVAVPPLPPTELASSAMPQDNAPARQVVDQEKMPEIVRMPAMQVYDRQKVIAPALESSVQTETPLSQPRLEVGRMTPLPTVEHQPTLVVPREPQPSKSAQLVSQQYELPQATVSAAPSPSFISDQAPSLSNQTTIVQSPSPAFLIDDTPSATTATPAQHLVPDQKPEKLSGKPNFLIAPRDVITQNFTRAIASVAVRDETVCKAFVVDGTSLTVMGVDPGATQIEIIYVDGDRQTITSETRSDRRVSQTANTEKMSSLMNTISELYPRSEIQIRTAENDTLIVLGKTASESEAREIVSLVRKMFLVPVEDRVSVGRRK